MKLAVHNNYLVSQILYKNRLHKKNGADFDGTFHIYSVSTRFIRNSYRSKFSSKIELFVKNRNFRINPNFHQKSTFSPRILIFFKQPYSNRILSTFFHFPHILFELCSANFLLQKCKIWHSKILLKTWNCVWFQTL